MEEKDIQLTEKEMQRMFDRIMEDDTHWDLMTGSLLTRRLKSYFKDTMSQTTFVEAMNCLRLTDLVYLYSQEGDSITMPTVPAPEGLTIMLFTSKRKITQASLKHFKTKEALLPDILESFNSDELKFIVINPCTDDFILPVDTVKEVFARIVEIIQHADEDKTKGITAKDLTPLMFERFGGCTIECDTADGRHIVGDAYSYCEDENGQCLTVKVSETENVDVYKSEIKYIKDITNYEEE